MIAILIIINIVFIKMIISGIRGITVRDQIHSVYVFREQIWLTRWYNAKNKTQYLKYS